MELLSEAVLLELEGTLVDRMLSSSSNEMNCRATLRFFFSFLSLPSATETVNIFVCNANDNLSMIEMIIVTN